MTSTLAQWKRGKQSHAQSKGYLNTGSTMLNLAISDDVNGGFPVGTVNNVIGDSSSGKTFLCMTSLACACQDPRFKDHEKIHDDAEHADNFNRTKLFGSSARQIVAPAVDEDGEPESSSLIEDVESFVYARTDANKPFVYVLDSMDSLSCKAELKASEERIKAFREGKEPKGSYGMQKAKLIGEFLRKSVKGIRRSDSCILIISQTRDNINPMSFVTQSRSGGRALKFYSSTEIWMAECSKLMKTVNGKPVELGIVTKIKIKKNKVTGKRRVIELPIYYDYGIDDIGSCVDFLMNEKHWKKDKNSVVAPEFGFKGMREKLISHIEDGNHEDKLKSIVQGVWNDVEDSLKIGRKPRFG